MRDEETLDVYDARAGDYAKFTTQSTPDTQLTAFLGAVPNRARLWDLGCGPGRSAMLMAQAGHDVLATDASAAMVELAAKIPGITVRQESFEQIQGEAIYDGIFANFSLLHADGPDLPGHIQAIARALKPEGVFHIGMKMGTGTKRDGIGRRYTYVTDASLTALLEDASLTPTQRWFGSEPGLDGVVAPFIIMHAVKHG